MVLSISAEKRTKVKGNVELTNLVDSSLSLSFQYCHEIVYEKSAF